MLRRILVTLLTFALLFSGATVPHSHAVPGDDDHAEHGRVPHLHAYALLDWFAERDQYEAGNELACDVDHHNDRELIAEGSGSPTIHSSSPTSSEHDNDALYVIADRAVAGHGDPSANFKPSFFAFIADVGRSLQRDLLRLCHDPPPPISIVPIYVRMLSLRI